MKYNFPAQSVDQLSQQLVSKGMIFTAPPDPKQHLTQIGFFRLKRYTEPFHVFDGKGGYTFLKETYFEDIISIYNFDCQLKSIILDALGNIEVTIKSLLNNTLTIKNGTHWYLDKNVFQSGFYTEMDENYLSRYDKFIYKITKECDESHEWFIKKYTNNYTDPTLPPSWLVLEIMSFGMSGILYQNLDSTDIRTEIADNFKVNQKFLETWLISMSYVRNQCAHHQKLINRKFKFPPKMPKREKNAFLKEYKIIEEDSLYAILCIIQYSSLSLGINPMLKDSILDLIQFNPQIVLSELGFTPDWKNENIWQ